MSRAAERAAAARAAAAAAAADALADTAAGARAARDNVEDAALDLRDRIERMLPAGRAAAAQNDAYRAPPR
jgi:hypothetical protein